MDKCATWRKGRPGSRRNAIAANASISAAARRTCSYCEPWTVDGMGQRKETGDPLYHFPTGSRVNLTWDKDGEVIATGLTIENIPHYAAILAGRPHL